MLRSPVREQVDPRRVGEGARLFTNGNSQAVALPKNLRVEGSEVVVKKIGDLVLLFPKKYSATRLKALLASLDRDFAIDWRACRLLARSRAGTMCLHRVATS